MKVKERAATQRLLCTSRPEIINVGASEWCMKFRCSGQNRSLISWAHRDTSLCVLVVVSLFGRLVGRWPDEEGDVWVGALICQLVAIDWQNWSSVLSVPPSSNSRDILLLDYRRSGHCQRHTIQVPTRRVVGGTVNRLPGRLCLITRHIPDFGLTRKATRVQTT